MQLYNALFESGGDVTLRTSATVDVTVGTITNLPANLGIQTAANSLSVVPASDANISRETYSTVTILAVTTNATGSTFQAFGSQVCTSLDLTNYSGTAIEYRRNGAGNAFRIPDGAARMIKGITNASQISVRRVDLSNTQVTLNAESFQV